MRRGKSKTRKRNYLILFIILIILVLFVIATYFYGNITGNAISSNSCIDSDNGINYFLKGNITKGRASYQDNCKTSSVLSEYYCTRYGRISILRHKCKNQCYDGVCVRECGDGKCDALENSSSCSNDCSGFSVLNVTNVCKLTGINSFNYRGSNLNIEGTDNGYIFEHNKTMFFLFGDSWIFSPGRYLSSVHAISKDFKASDCISLSFSNIKDLFADTSDFYAQESSLQANECKNKSCNFEGCCSEIDNFIYRNYKVHYQWSSSQNFDIVRNEFIRKSYKILNYYNSIDRKKMADYYARTAVRLAGYGISFSDNLPSYRNSQNYFVQFGFANDPVYKLGTSACEPGTIMGELCVKYDSIFNSIKLKSSKQTLASKTSDSELTTITTSGISFNNTIYLYFMSVKGWDPWDVYYTGVAYSSDNGKTFTRVDNFFPSNSNFIQSSLVQEGDYLYLFGTPTQVINYQYGIKLARVETDKILNKNDYRYCKLENLNCTWVKDETMASVILPAYFSTSVQWDKYLGKYIMTYYSQKGDIEIRESDNLQGNWSSPKVLVSKSALACSNTADDRCYGPYMHSAYFEKDGKIIYFILSDWSDYNIYLYKAELEKD